MALLSKNNIHPMSVASANLPTAERFQRMLKRTGLVRHDDLQLALDRLDRTERDDPRLLADVLIAERRLTRFQAVKLLQGTWQGLVLGPYQILAPLGRGGMGTVYLARNTQTEVLGFAERRPSLVALKVLPPKRAKADERTRARFLREMDMCQRVEHPHLTKTFDAGQIEGVYYIAMEYIRGVNLSQYVKAEGPLPAERAARLFSEIAAGLAHAHEKGLIHRDLKPSNIMVTPNGHAKILDLGLALGIDEELPADKMIVGGQGYVVGTMDYIAPEQVDDPSRVDARADLYALGCTLYFTLVGQPPFPGGTSVQKMQRHRKEYPSPIPDVNPTVPVNFAHIVEKLMEKRPSKRYASAGDVREALLPWAEGDEERPLDVDPMLNEAQAIEELEKERGSWWESVPVISFGGAEAGNSTDIYAEQPSTENQALMALLIVVGLVGLITFLEMIRH